MEERIKQILLSQAMSRLVRCPKCSKLLVENSTVPLYQCDGCGTVLRAKNYKASGDNAIAESPQISNNQENRSEIGISDNGSTSANKYKASGDDAITEPIQLSSNQENHTEIGISDIVSTSATEMIIASSSSPSLKLNGEEEKKMAPNDNLVCSSIEDRQHNKNGGLFETDRVVENSSILEFNKHNGQSPTESKHHVTDQANDESIDEQINHLIKANDQGSDHLKMNNEVGQSPKSFSNSMASEEMAETLQNNELDVLELTANMFSSYAYKSSISSDDGQAVHSPNRQFPKSTTSFRHQPLLKGKKQEIPLERNEMTAYNKSDRQLGTRLSTSSNERHSIDATRDQISLRYKNGEHEREKSFDSTESQHNWMMEKGAGSSRSLEKDSPVSNNANSHLELLRKLDELRVQVTELYAKRSPPEGIHEIQNFDTQPSLSLYHHPQRPSYGRSPQHYHHMQEMPSSRYSQCTCLQCERERKKLANLHKKGPYRSDANDMHSRNPKEHDTEKSYLSNRLKHRCRPVSGAAPFVICYNCVKLLLLPADFLITKKKLHKLQCAACNEILMFSFPDRASSNPETSSRLTHSPTEVDNRKNGLNYHSNDSFQGYPLSSFDDHGTPLAKNYSNESPLHVSRKAYDRLHLKGKRPAQLHRLMGYGSASELLYQHEESDDGSETSEILVHHSRRSSNEIHASNKSGGSGRSSPDSMVIHEEGGSHRSS